MLEGQAWRPVSNSAFAAHYSRDLATSLARFAFKRVRRTRGVVDAEYDSGHWKQVLDAQAWRCAATAEDFLIGNETRLLLAKVDGNIVRIPDCDYRRYRIGALSRLFEGLTEEAVGLVEIGSGFGYNLFSLSCRNKAQRYTGLDIALNGIEAGRQIAAHYGIADRIAFDRLDITDANDPSLARLAGQTVFTYFCIEQIPYAVENAVSNIMRARPRRVINIEPSVDMLDLRHPRDIVGHAYIRSMDYQTRLFKVLDRLEWDGKIKVLVRQRMPFAPTIHNDGLLYCWEPNAP